MAEPKMAPLEPETQDTEITLGTGKLLGIFFTLAVLCGLFFSMGYVLGHSTAGSDRTQIISRVPSSGSPNGKPGAGNKATDTTITQDCTPGTTNCPAAASGPDSSFYNSVSKNTPDSQMPAGSSQPAPAQAPAGNTNPAPSASIAANTKTAPPGSYIVQVAAVSKQEDAETLVNFLRKKQYPVFISSNSGGDSLFHVQVGPFTDPKEAEAMRTRLVNDGYNAIVKK